MRKFQVPHLAIVGAGAAGLAAARRLRELRPDIAITLYEQGSAPGGRMATGRRAGFAFDHGAQYVKTPTPALHHLLTAALPAGELIDIGQPVWIFDGDGQIAEGDPAQNAGPKWTYRAGLDWLASLLAEGLDVRCGTRVAALRSAGDRWLLADAAGQKLGLADAVLLTQPAPEAAELLSASELDREARSALIGELERARYRPCISLALAYAARIARPYYALVNTDRAHPIAWLALEHAKDPARCPPDHSLLIAQMAPRWSDGFWRAPDDELAARVDALVAALLGADPGRPLWCDIRRWRHALPDSRASFESLNGVGAGRGLFFAGDATAGQGRVHLAIESGWRAADTIAHARGW